VDPTDYHIVYSESQDGNANRYDLRTGRGQSIRPRARQAGRGDAQTAAGAPGGASPPPAARPGGFPQGPPHALNTPQRDQHRFHWNPPFILSPHTPSIVWRGGNRLFKSYNRGDTWIASPDLTKQIDRNRVSLMGMAGDRTQLSKNDGVVAY